MLQPKKKNITPKDDDIWLQNWLKNRVISDPKLNKDYQEEKDLYIKESLKKNPIKYIDKIDDSNTQGEYDKNTNEISLLNNPAQGVYTHEKSHAINMPLQNTKTSLNAFNQISQNVLPKDKIDNQWIKDNYNEISNYNEVLPRLNVYRQKYNLQPDQIITPDLIKSNRELYKSNPDQFEDNTDQLYKLFEDEGLSNVLNKVVMNNNKQSNNVAAYGGKLNMNMKINYANGGQLTKFDEGGTHEQNPLGGVPQGQSPDGSMNTVEEGETKLNDYIYSNRISLDKDLVKQFNLPGYVANKSVSDASKAIDNKFKDRFDKYSNETKTTLLNRLTEAQEFIKQQEQIQQDQINQSLQANSQQVPDMMNGEIPAGMEEFVNPNQQVQSEQMIQESQPIAAYGGYQKKYFAGGSLISMGAEAGKGISNNTNTSGLELSNDEMMKQEGWEKAKDVAGQIPILGLFRGAEKLGKGLGQSIGGDKGGDFASGFLDPMQNVFSKDTNVGEKALSLLDPVVSGIIMNKKNDKRRAEQAQKNALNYNKQFSEEYAKGGKLKRPKIESVNYLNPVGVNYTENDDITSTANIYSKAETPNPSLFDNAKLLGKNLLNYGKENYGEALRYAPIAMNAYQLSKLKKPTGVQYNTLDNRYKPTYVDEARLQNTIGQEANNQINAISQMGGSEGATRNAILAAGLNKTKALSNAYANVTAQNASENQTAQQFNLGVDSTNVAIRNKAIDEMRMDQGNYDTQKSKLLSSLGTDVGSIGREISDKKQIADLLGYTWNGKYITDKDGKPISDDQIKKELIATKSQSAYGGKLNLKYK